MSGKDGPGEFKRIMEQPPSWAKDGLPIPCEVYEGRRWLEPAKDDTPPTRSTKAQIRPPLWRVRVCLPDIIHLVSATEPIVHMRNGRISDVTMELVTDAPGCGDTVGFIDWSAVVAVSWRLMKNGRIETPSDARPRA
jgi:hypothetical protein